MSNGLITIKGYLSPMPPAADEALARVSIMHEDMEYRIVPRGAGVDLDDYLSMLVEVTGLATPDEGFHRLQVRGYRILEDEEWLDDRA